MGQVLKARPRPAAGGVMSSLADGQVVELNAETEDPSGPAPLAPLCISVEAAAELLGIGVSLARQLVAAGDLPTVRIRTRRLVRVADLRQFVEELR